MTFWLVLTVMVALVGLPLAGEAMRSLRVLRRWRRRRQRWPK